MCKGGAAVDFWGMPDHIKKLECNFYKVQCSALIVSKIGETNKTTEAKVNSRLDPTFPLTPHSRANALKMSTNQRGAMCTDDKLSFNQALDES